MKKLSLFLSMFALVLACERSKSQDSQTDLLDGFDYIPEVREPEITEPTLIGGKPANPKDFPASVYAQMRGARCSATVVGSQVLIIAAHCVSHGGTVGFTIGANAYSGTCSRSPLYRKGTDHDLALCKISKEIPELPFEVLNQDESLIKTGTEIQLTGYGCTRPGGGGGNDGTFRIGEANITRETRPYDFVARGQAALCFGDSGGAAFLYLDAEKTKRVQISVNSKGDIRTTSYLTSLSSEASKEFISSWANQNNVKICGVHADATGCRHGSDQKPPENPPVLTCKLMYDKLASCIKEDVAVFRFTKKE